MAETAEQTMVALPWQQGEATGTLNLPASTKVLDLLSGIGYVPVLSREILLWRAAYLASLGACLRVMRAGARHLLWCILGSQGAKHAALASCGVAGKPC